MSQTNLIDFTLNENDQQTVNSAIDTLLTTLQPLLINLSNEDRRELPKMGEKTLSFVEKAQEYAQLNPQIVPKFLDLEAFSRDMETVKILAGFARQLQPFMQSLDDSVLAAGSESYQSALVFYRSVKMAKDLNEPNARAVYEDLVSRFPGNSSRPALTPAS